jgi:hypothetical protein
VEIFILNKLLKKWQTPLRPKSLKVVKEDLKKKSKKNIPDRCLTQEEKWLVRLLKEKTNQLNLNNITRTKAYLDYFKKHPEIHWAFLAHMVSRNAGWNMTDLKGEWLGRLLNKKEQQDFFAFIERGNWLIFQDAFPQLLVYEESKNRQHNLFHLLSHMDISTFMHTLWNHFWIHHDSKILTTGLIINEQNYIESRVLQNPYYQKEVLNTIEFHLQDFLSLNHILFPLNKKGNIRLLGQTVHYFENLHQRIQLGKELYSLLFTNKEHLDLVKEWAFSQPHTGSRKDYWPHFFHDIQESSPGTSLKPRINDCSLQYGSTRIYSPTLYHTWKNIRHFPADNSDWFNDWKVVYDLGELENKENGEIEADYCQTLRKLELTIVAKKAISFFDS